MPRILIIEDEVDLRQVLEFNFEKEGYDVLLAATGAEGLLAAQKQRPDVVLLDLMLPDLSGRDVCRLLKEDAKTQGIPVIMVTARGEESDRVIGFELGADDYVVKPFSVRELVLRVQAVTRRQAKVGGAGEQIRFGLLAIDRNAHRVWVGGNEVELTALEFRLLVTLYERKNRVQTRSALLDDVWGMRADITTRTVDTHVKRLREKLDGARDYIETVRGVGYRFRSEPERS